MVGLDKLYRIAAENAAAVRAYRKRKLFHEVQEAIERVKVGKRPAVLVAGMRGIGKTTVLLQMFSEFQDSFYFSADSILVKSESVYSIVENAWRSGYKTMLIDEVHKYPGWVAELKSIYDDFGIAVIVSGSSSAALKKGAIELGRRAFIVEAEPLALSEYLYLKEGKEYAAALEDALDRKRAIRWLAEHPDVEKYYREYLDAGAFPLSPAQALFSTVKKMIYEDALAEFALTENRVDVSERLLSFVAASKPGEFSYTSFSSISSYSKSTVYEAVNLLRELGLLRIVEGKTPKELARSSMKLVFSHPNLRSAVCSQLMREPELGALREEYFIFHMGLLGFRVSMPKGMKKNPDYLVRMEEKEILFEIGGASKTVLQFEGKQGVVMSDENLIVLGFVQKDSKFVQKTDQK